MSFRRLLLICTCAASGLFAQRWDVMFSGGVGFQDKVETGIGGVRIGTGRAAAMLNIGAAFADAGPGRFEYELPICWSGSAEVVANESIVTAADSTWSIIPGIRYRLAPHRRVTPFGAFGVGAARATEVTVARFDVVAIGAGVTRLAIGFGGGLDLRVAGPLTLRAELRDQMVRNTIGVRSQWDHRPMFLGGIGFRF